MIIPWQTSQDSAVSRQAASLVVSSFGHISDCPEKPLAEQGENRGSVPFGRAALKSSNLAGQVTDDQIYAAAHFLQESRTGAVAGFVLVASPSAILSLHGATEDAQHGGGHGMAHAAAVFSGADIQTVMGAVLNAPVLPGQFEQARRVGLTRAQAGDQPNGFHLLASGAELADAVQTRQLQDMRETHLFGRDRDDLDAAPLDAAVALFNLQQLRGKNLPAGSVALGPGVRLGCL